MLAEREVQDKWTQIVGALLRAETIDDRARTSRRNTRRGADRRAAFDGRGHASVTVIERPTSTSATIAWRDSTNCRYGAQLWRLVRARKPGVCALSGVPIRPGEEIFKPCGRLVAANADAMIHSAALHAFPALND